MSGFERKMLDSGDANPKYVDVLDEDEGIAGQKFACMSFLSPEKILEKRELFLFDRFVQEFDFIKSMSKFGDFINFISYKYSLNPEKIMEDFNDFSKEEQESLKKNGVADDFNNFLDKQEEKLNEQFQREHAFQTSVRGLKLRGSFPTQEEAESFCKALRKKDPNHDIFVAPVGIWLPWDPNAYKTGKVEFLEEELNQLYQEKMKNEQKAKDEFDKRVKETKRKAIEENIKKAEESGNKLTQTINENDELIGVRQNIDFESREVADDDERKKHEEELMEQEKNRHQDSKAANIRDEMKED